MEPEIKTLVDEWGKGLESIKDIRSEMDELKSKGDGIALLEEKMDKAVEATIAAGEDHKRRLDELDAKAARPGLGADDGEPKRNSSEVIRAMYKAQLAMRDGQTVPDEVKALLVGNDTSAGFLVQEDWRPEIIEKLLVETDPTRSLARVVSTTGNSLIWPTKTAHAAASWEGEGATSTADTTMTFGQEEIPTHKQRVVYDVSTEMLEDSAFDIGGLLRDEFVQEFAVDEGAAFVLGTGVSQPKGFMANADVLANYVFSGNATSFTNSWEWVTKLMVKNKTPYWNNSSWCMSRSTFGVLLAHNDGVQRSYLAPNTTSSLPMMVYGRPVVLSPTMADIGSGAYPIAFGDFRRGYVVLDKVGFSLQVDPFTQNMTDKVRYVARRRVGGQVVIPEAIAVLKLATS